MVQIAFYGFAALTLGGALAVLLTRTIMYAAFFLLLALLGVAGLFVLASADFLAVAQLMIYVGGVLVLVIFGVMLTHKAETSAETNSQTANRIPALNRGRGGAAWLIPLLVSGGIFAVFFTLLLRSSFVLLNQPVGWQTTIGTIGRQLMTEYVVPFEIVGILLLAALVGATYLASPMAKK